LYGSETFYCCCNSLHLNSSEWFKGFFIGRRTHINIKLIIPPDALLICVHVIIINNSWTPHGVQWNYYAECYRSVTHSVLWVSSKYWGKTILIVVGIRCHKLNRNARDVRAVPNLLFKSTSAVCEQTRLLAILVATVNIIIFLWLFFCVFFYCKFD